MAVGLTVARVTAYCHSIHLKTKPLDEFVYDPATPVPSLGGHTCCTGTDTEAGGYDQSDIEMRNDVLVYTSDVLEEGIEVTGPTRGGAAGIFFSY